MIPHNHTKKQFMILPLFSCHHATASAGIPWHHRTICPFYDFHVITLLDFLISMYRDQAGISGSLYIISTIWNILWLHLFRPGGEREREVKISNYV